MPTICAHIAGYNFYVHHALKTGQQYDLKFWMLTSTQPSFRELGEKHLTGTGDSEYEFGGVVIAEMAINEAIILIIDTGVLQFYTSGGSAADANKNASKLGKFARGKGKLTLGEYPYDMGVKFYQVTIKQLKSVAIPKSSELNQPLYLSPGAYTDADMNVVSNLENVTDPRSAFFLVDLELED